MTSSSLKNRVKLIEYLISNLKNGIPVVRQDSFGSSVIQAYKEKKVNPSSDVKILFGIISDEVEHCWLEINGEEIETFSNKSIEKRSSYEKIIKILLLSEFKIEVCESKVDELLYLINSTIYTKEDLLMFNVFEDASKYFCVIDDNNLDDFLFYLMESSKDNLGKRSRQAINWIISTRKINGILETYSKPINESKKKYVGVCLRRAITKKLSKSNDNILRS